MATLFLLTLSFQLVKSFFFSLCAVILRAGYCYEIWKWGPLGECYPTVKLKFH